MVSGIPHHHRRELATPNNADPTPTARCLIVPGARTCAAWPKGCAAHANLDPQTPSLLLPKAGAIAILISQLSSDTKTGFLQKQSASCATNYNALS